MEDKTNTFFTLLTRCIAPPPSQQTYKLHAGTTHLDKLTENIRPHRSTKKWCYNLVTQFNSTHNGRGELGKDAVKWWWEGSRGREGEGIISLQKVIHHGFFNLADQYKFTVIATHVQCRNSAFHLLSYSIWSNKW